jgi:predicted DNA binding CopG/RHH family protein
VSGSRQILKKKEFKIMPTILIFILLSFALLRFTMRNTGKIEQKKNEAFWEKERQANNTRKQDISDLPYIDLAKAALPYDTDESDIEIRAAREGIKKMADAKILKLTGISNTDLKLAYGAANLNFLSACDENYSRLVRLLNKWGRLLFEKGKNEDALQVLSYAVSIESDIEETYILLAKYYKENGNVYKIDELKSVAGINFEEARRNIVLSKLDDIIRS